MHPTIESKVDGCQCKVCVLSHKVQAVQEKLSAEDRAVIEQLLNEWTHESMEAGRAKTVLKGSWPDTKPIAAAPKTACAHDWNGTGDAPASWFCCGVKVYRSYEDYVDD